MDAKALARLKRLAGRSTLILTHYGRKSGKPYEVTIWFVVDGDKVFIGTADVRHQWIKNVQKNPRIKLSVGGEKFEAEARFLDDHRAWRTFENDNLGIQKGGNPRVTNIVRRPPWGAETPIAKAVPSEVSA